MSCYACLTKFSFFTKELSCANCRFSFCSKCLKQKAVVGEAEKNVCKNCFKKLISTSNIMSSPEPNTPDLLNRLETLENPAKPPITIFRHSNRLNNLKYGLSPEDKRILERLEKLKADHKATTVPDDSEIKRRLALLQGKSEESVSNKPSNLQGPQKSHQEQVDDLLNQYLGETDIEIDLERTESKGFEDIEGRLKKLQMSDSSEVSEKKFSRDEIEDEETVTKNIIKRAIAEGQLEKKLQMTQEKEDYSDVSDIDDTESEFPWCSICNENATVRCFGCDGSLYCNTCFKQGHEYFNMENHKFIPYTKKDSLEDD